MVGLSSYLNLYSLLSGHLRSYVIKVYNVENLEEENMAGDPEKKNKINFDLTPWKLRPVLEGWQTASQLEKVTERVHNENLLQVVRF